MKHSTITLTKKKSEYVQKETDIVNKIMIDSNTNSSKKIDVDSTQNIPRTDDTSQTKTWNNMPK